ncbi:hypothetical protein ACMZ6Z_08870 [Streptococcus pluranimalium]|uniref:hypothetical protein n=1 Tax=Streptococcus pluranimalium TaxID=82348 RepID=UPI0039FD3AD1
MNDELSIELSRGKIIDNYVTKFFNRLNYHSEIEELDFSSNLIDGVEDVLFSLDSNDRLPEDLLSELQYLLGGFVNDNLENYYNLKSQSEFTHREKLLEVLSKLIYDEKKWVKYNQNSKKLTSNIRRCILKVLDAITEFQNAQIVYTDNLIEILNSEYPITQVNRNNQVFLSHAYVDRIYTLGLFLYFYDKGIYLYIDWMHQAQGLLTKKIKNNLLSAINNSAQLLFLRTLNSELGLQGGSRQIREWCAWEIGTFDYKSNNASSEGFYIDRYRQNRQVKSRSQLIQDYQPLRAIKNGRLY